MPPYESVFQVIESGRGGKNLEKLPMKATLLTCITNPYYRIPRDF